MYTKTSRTGNIQERLSVLAAPRDEEDASFLKQRVSNAGVILIPIAKVCASWKLYEHSNGFRAKNFWHSLKMWKSIRKNRKLAALKQYGFCSFHIFRS